MQRFDRQGYLTLDGMTTPGELASIRQVYDGCIAWGAGLRGGGAVDLTAVDAALVDAGRVLVRNPHHFFSALRDTQYEARARALLEQVCGGGFQLRETYALYKPPRWGCATPWHQDEAYLPSEGQEELVTFWMALQEVTVESGCLHFLPGSHRGEVLPHHPIQEDPQILELDAGVADLSAAVACPLPAGGATVHAMRTLHYAGPNTSNAPRRAFILDFARTRGPVRS